MTPERFRECLATIGWTPHQLATILSMEERQTRRWASGAYAVPERVAEWLERVAAFHAANPPPPRAKRSAGS